jgi:hypothetical protein
MFQINETRLIGTSCIYDISIKTNCNSPTYTTDGISISIGDANGNEVCVYLYIPPRFRNTWMVTFCSSLSLCHFNISHTHLMYTIKVLKNGRGRISVT